MASDQSAILSSAPRKSRGDFCVCTRTQRVRRIDQMLFSPWALCKHWTHCGHRYKGLHNEVGTWVAFRSERREASADRRSNDGRSSRGLLRLASALIHLRAPSNLCYPGNERCRRYLYETWEAGWAVSREGAWPRAAISCSGGRSVRQAGAKARRNCRSQCVAAHCGAIARLSDTSMPSSSDSPREDLVVRGDPSSECAKDRL